MISLEADWAFLRAAMPDLRKYVLSNELYWSARAVGGARIPQLTIGNLLLAQARLSAADLTAPEKEERASLAGQARAVREEWRANWGQKAAREFGSRLNLWQQYLRELRGDPRAQDRYYAREVRNRAILQLLAPEALPDIPNSEKEQLAMLDTLARGLTRPGAFVWEEALQRGFPVQEFWFLYVALVKKP